jgi:RNA polymerase sigma-70 factor (ECF subfamily)
MAQGVARAEQAFVPPLLPLGVLTLIGSLKAVEAIGTAEDRDGTLASRIEEGDEQALEQVYEEYSAPVFAFLVSRMRQREAAEDVLQQVFVEVWQKAGNFDPDRGRLGSWIMSIASSRSIDALRRRVPEPRDPVSFPESGEPSNPGGVDEFLADWDFARTIDRLPESEAELLRLRFSEDLSQSEIAEKTGIPLGTVKSKMVAGLNTLREEMGVG